ERVGDSIQNGRRGADRAALANTLNSGNARIRNGFEMMDFEVRNFRHGWDEVIREGTGQDVSVRVVMHHLVQRVRNALRDAAMDLAFENHRVEYPPGVFENDEPLHFDRAGRDVALGDCDMASIRESAEWVISRNRREPGLDDSRKAVALVIGRAC